MGPAPSTQTYILLTRVRKCKANQECLQLKKKKINAVIKKKKTFALF